MSDEISLYSCGVSLSCIHKTRVGAWICNRKERFRRGRRRAAALRLSMKSRRLLRRVTKLTHNANQLWPIRRTAQADIAAMEALELAHCACAQIREDKE